MTQSTKKYQALMMVLLFALSVVTSCGGGGGSTGGGGGGGGGVYPGTPTGVTVTVNKVDATQGTVTLHWNAATNAATYRVRYADMPGLTKATGTSYPNVITGTSFTTQAYSVNSVQYFIVTALASNGIEGPASAEVSAKIAAPSQPSTLIAVASSDTNTPSVSLSWSAVNEATSYNLYRDTTSSVTTILVTGISSTATLYTDTTVTNGTTYYYVLKGENAFGLGAASMVTSATPTSGTLTTVTISGKVKYEDKEYDRNVGFTGVTTFKAVRYANIELVNAASGNPILPAGRTSADGSYSISVSPSYIDTGVYVRIISSTTPTGFQSMNVRDWSSRPFSVKTNNFTLAGNTSIDLSIPVTSAADGAFNILDVMTSGFQFINAHAVPSTLLTNLSLNAFWQNDVSNGTYYCNQTDPTYCPGGTGIYILSDPFGSGDTDEFDDDVLLHEFGHFTADNFSRDDSMGGMHYLNENDYDMRLTWSEGWGNYFQGAVKFWLDPTLVSLKPGVPRSQYIDTVSGQVALTVDIADPSNDKGYSDSCIYFGTNYCTYSTNEIAVANVLWNHLTGTGAYGMQPIWDVIAGFKSLAPTTTVNLEAFWDGWKAAANPDPIAIYQNRLINYSNDGYEPDNDITSAATITVGLEQSRTLYSSLLAPDVDIDYVKFVVPSSKIYTITTNTLINGATTKITLYDTDKNFMATNDNVANTTWLGGPGDYWCSGNENYDCYSYPSGVWQEVRNNTTNLASTIVTTTLSPGTYYIEITSAANKPKSAGKYGSYSLLVQ
ncbi:MAG: phage tail protein [Nitrospirota bacterium]